jgi:hypothetical protein
MTEKITPLLAHRYRCFECHGWDPNDPESMKPVKAVRECEERSCWSWKYRFGKNPDHALSKAKRSFRNLNKFQKHCIIF